MTDHDPGASTNRAERSVEDRIFVAALFDMDGTLIDSTPAVNRSWIRWGEEYSLPEGFREGMHGRPARDLVTALIAPDEVEKALARVTQLELDDTDGVVTLAGARELLGSLDDARRAIVTSCTRELAAVRIAAAGLPTPAVVVTITDTERGKPNPDPFLEGARRLGVDPRDCVVFEDAPAGLAAAKAAGCTTVAVTGTHLASELDADLVLPSLAAVSVEFVPGGFRLVV